MTHLRLITALSALGTAGAFAQPPMPPPPHPGAHVIIREREINGPGPGGMMESRFRVEMGAESKIVKGAPYSAQAASETTQTLADGTRISRKTSTTLARDSEGRTRREETLSSVGPWSTDGQARTMVFINDPVAQSQYVLDASNHSANKMANRSVQFRRSGSPDGGDSAQMAKRHAERAASQNDKAHAEHRAKAQANIKTESLGNQTIAGVAATGTRVTHTIPAGEIGNDRAINIVSETWYSDDLQMVVMSKHSDPRSGETTYALSNVQRAEPAASLFTVPADYTVQENTNHVFVNKIVR